MRVVPNKYPAFEHHEVVVHTPRHTRSIAELADEEVSLVAEAWLARARVAEKEGFPYMQAVLNEGRAAGGSLAHGHSQLVWLDESPPLVAADYNLASATPVAERMGIVLAVPHAARAPYELVVAPTSARAGAFRPGSELAVALQLLAEGIRRLHAVEGPVPLNAWLHTPAFGKDGHWHIEVLPRFSIIASLELGAGIYINSLAPEEAAARLRDVAVSG